MIESEKWPITPKGSGAVEYNPGGWRDIATAPKDGTRILIAAHGVDGTGWMRDIAHWGCSWHAHSSSVRSCPGTCMMRWLLAIGIHLTYYDAPVTHWMPLPEPPTDAPPQRETP